MASAVLFRKSVWSGRRCPDESDFPVELGGDRVRRQSGASFDPNLRSKLGGYSQRPLQGSAGTWERRAGARGVSRAGEPGRLA